MHECHLWCHYDDIQIVHTTNNLLQHICVWLLNTFYGKAVAHI